MWNSDRKNIETIPRAYYHGSCEEFLLASEAEIYHELVHNSLQFDLKMSCYSLRKDILRLNILFLEWKTH